MRGNESSNTAAGAELSSSSLVRDHEPRTIALRGRHGPPAAPGAPPPGSSQSRAKGRALALTGPQSPFHLT